MYCFFEDAGQYRAGRILSKADTSLQLELQSGRRVKIKQAACLLEFSGPEPEAFLAQAQSQAEALDPDFLWQCAPQDDFTFTDFAQEVYGAGASVLEQASLALALHAAPMYFYRRGKGVFRPAPQEALQAALAGAERKRLAAEAQARMEETIIGGTEPLPPEITSQAITLLIRPDKQSLAYKALEEGWSVGMLNSNPQIIGFVGYKAIETLKNTLVFGVEEKGRGSIVYLVDNPLFRGFWENGKLLFSNAIFFH